MRIHYEIIPSDYYQELCEKGKRGRRKAAAFLSYAMDGARGYYNSERFYAEVWKVSPSTVHEWIKDFDYELDRFEAARRFRREEHKRSVKNQTEQIEQSKSSKSSTQEPPKNGGFEKSAEQIEQSKSSKDILLNDDDAGARMRRRELEDLYWLYRINTKNAGRVDEAWEAYQSLDDEVDHQSMQRAVVMYLHDREISKRYNLANFLRNRIYLNYMAKRMRVLIGDEWVVGEYDDEIGVFETADGRKWKLTASTLADKLGRGELRFEVGDAAA